MHGGKQLMENRKPRSVFYKIIDGEFEYAVWKF
jgi:hypothetical protein